MSAQEQEVIERQSTALTLQQRALAAIKLQVTETQLSELAAKTVDITSITNADGRKQAHAAAMVLADQRIAIDKAGKSARDDATKFAKEVITQAGKLIALIEPEEKRLLKLRDEWDAKIEQERKAKAEAERQRVARIQDDIEQDLRCVPHAMVGQSAANIDRAIRDIVSIEITPERFAEFVATAASAKECSLTKLRDMHARQVAHEGEQERIRLEREENERQRIANEAALKVERERLAAEQAEAKRKAEGERAAAAAERQRLLDEHTAKLRAERAESERLAKIERERLAEERRKHEAEAAQRERIDRERIEAERAAAQAEHARIAAENARKAAELRQQEEALEQQRKNQEAARLELERQQQQLTTTVVAQTAAATEPEAPALLSTEEQPSHQPIDERPSRIELVAVVANHWSRSQATAETWLVQEFAK